MTLPVMVTPPVAWRIWSARRLLAGAMMFMTGEESCREEEVAPVRTCTSWKVERASRACWVVSAVYVRVERLAAVWALRAGTVRAKAANASREREINCLMW